MALNGKVADSEDIVGDETLHGAGTILNAEFGSVRLIRRRLGGVVLGMKEAGYGCALGAGNPEVARAGKGPPSTLSGTNRGGIAIPGIEDDLELGARQLAGQTGKGDMTYALGRGAEGDLSKVLGVHEVWEVIENAVGSEMREGTHC